MGADLDSECVRLVAASLRRLRLATGVDLAFCGEVRQSGLTLTQFDGRLAGPLRAAVIDVGEGLGGRVVACSRPFAVPDYVRTASITHQYDAIIRAEALHAMAAAPVHRGPRPSHVLYVGMRTSQRELGRMMDAVTREARRLEHQLVVAEVLWGIRGDEAPRRQDTVPEVVIRDVYADLRRIATEIPDAALQSRLLASAARLTRTDQTEAGTTVQVTGRELDVLTLMAAGMPNAGIAEELGISLYTVKGHAKSLFTKLGSRSRLEAVLTAKRLDLLA